MRAIARKYADKTLANPGLTFVLLLFGTSAVVLLGLAFGIGLHAIYALFRSDGLVLYALAILLGITAARTILGGLKEMLLFWSQVWQQDVSTIEKWQATLAFGLDFFVTEVFRAGAYGAFAWAAVRAVVAGITLDPFFFIGAGALLVGTYVQAIVSAAYLRWHVTREAYTRTILIDATIQGLGVLEPTMRLMRSVVRQFGLFTFAAVLLVLYKTLDIALYFVLPVLAQKYLGGAIEGYALLLSAFWLTVLLFTGALVAIVRLIILEYRAWTTYSKRLVLAGLGLVAAVAGDGVVRISSLYAAYASNDVGVAVSAFPFVIALDLLAVLLMLLFSRILIEDW